MNELYPIIRRQRQSLQTAITPAAQPVVAVCPHCGRSASEPASVTMDPNLPTAPEVVKVKPTAPKTHDDAAKP